MTLQRRARTFLFLYIAIVVYLSLFPGEFLLHPRANGLYWVPGDSRRIELDTVLNVLFYLPVGAAGFLALGRGLPAWLFTVLLGSSLSWLIEWIQLWTPTRYGNLRDLAANSAGTLIGASVAWLLRSQMETWVTRFPGAARWRLPSSSRLLLFFWMCWQTFPFFPSLSLYRLKDGVAGWSWLTFGEHAVGFFALTLGLDQARWKWLALGLLPAQFLLADRRFSPAALAGAALGWGVSSLLGRENVRAGRWSLPAWLAFEEFRPFAISPETHIFGWLPFNSWFENNSTGYYATVFSKLFLYTAVVWVLRRTGARQVTAIAIPAAILMMGEWAQQWLAGRTPESTDWVLLAIGAVLLTLGSEKPEALESAEVGSQTQ